MNNDPAFTSHPALSRRRFLQTASLAAFATSGSMRLAALAPGQVGETEHFLYRLAPAGGPWIDTQRGNRAFGFSAGKIHLSEDNAQTWKHEADFADAEDIQFSSLLGNGRVVFATQRRIFTGNEDLTGIQEVTVLDHHGEEYRPHLLREGEKPGWYFYSLDGVHTFEVEGREMLIWGNYCNVGTGPVPANIYYSTDGGKTVKIAYAFGRNPAFQHKDADPSEWLGDKDNPVVCRHIHSVSYNAPENAFYACTGDIDRKNGAGLECHWLRGTWDAKNDLWDWKVIVSSDANSRFKSGGINCVDGQIYWVADANGPKSIREDYDRGIFRCAPADLPDKAKHTLLYPVKYEMAAMTIHDGVIVAPKYGNADPDDCGFLFSPDLGKSWGHYDLKELGDRSGVRVNPPNGEGWWRVALMSRWTNRGEVLFLKPKR
ncbi:MAG TPA: hypothetical protein DDZ88_28480 [Verrucomicrobiales bacterium]|nr:hypothetical protein [Verrucomicrobiales bacterium]